MEFSENVGRESAPKLTFWPYFENYLCYYHYTVILGPYIQEFLTTCVGNFWTPTISNVRRNRNERRFLG